MKLAAILINGDFRIHAASCVDIMRDSAKSDAGAWFIEATDRHDANMQCWGDVASDNYPEGSPEWHAACDTNASVASRYLPCARDLPETKENRS